jgi:hypothetical protein
MRSNDAYFQGSLGGKKMKLCIVGIGGAGGKITQEFLGNEDLDFQLLSRITEAEYLSPGEIKGIWLEADKNDAKNIQHFFGDMMEGCYPCYYIPHDVVPDSSPVHIAVRQKYGYDVKKQGFVRDAQYLKAIFEIFETDEEIQECVSQTISRDTVASIRGNGAGNGIPSVSNPIFDSAWNAIRGFTTLGDGECDGILFIVSFGGGTGTGFINPIINHIRNEGKADYPVFALGILTELGDFADAAQFSKEGRRNLAAISAIYDLLTKGGGANGVIIVDNEILLKRFGNDYVAANKFIHKMMQPLVAARDYPGEIPPSQAVAQHSSGSLSRPPIFVPFFASLPRSATEEALIERALSEDERLFPCTPDKADFAMVFCRGFIDSDKIRKILSQETGILPEMIWPIRKMGEGKNEILILLRNPYGGDPKAYLKENTLEKRFCKVISLALQYVRQNPEDLFYEGIDEGKDKKRGQAAEKIRLTEKSKEALRLFFFGPDGTGKTEGFVFELKEARKRLSYGEKPFFDRSLRIFQKDFAANGIAKAVTGPTYADKDIEKVVDMRIVEKLQELGLIKN